MLKLHSNNALSDAVKNTTKKHTENRDLHLLVGHWWVLGHAMVFLFPGVVMSTPMDKALALSPLVTRLFRLIALSLFLSLTSFVLCHALWKRNPTALKLANDRYAGILGAVDTLVVRTHSKYTPWNPNRGLPHKAKETISKDEEKRTQILEIS